MSNPNKGKSYSQVMNEWNAQRSFLKRASSTLLRPPMGTQGGSLLWGWIWRLLLLVLIPAIFYVGWIRVHAKSGVFTTQLADETKKYLGVSDIKFWRSRWDWNGELRIEKITAKGSPANSFTEFEATNVNTWITVPAVFKKAWHLQNVDAFSAKIKLRNGRAAAVADLTTAGRLLTAGWGISPDFSQLEIDGYSCKDLQLSWGSNPANSGELMNTRAFMQRKNGGWETTFEGGTARQGWLGNLKLSGLRLNIFANEVRIEKGDFILPGGGSATLTGGITLGESPEIKATLLLANAPFHDFLPDYMQKTIQAVCEGRVDLSGSTNRSSGVILDAKLNIKSGSVRSIPILHTLEIVTGESRLSQPTLVGGQLNFTSQGANESGGTVVESKDILLDCGTLMKLALTFRHERKPVIADNIKDSNTGAASVSVNTTAKLRIGLAPELAAKLNAAIRTEFGAREEQGFHWIDVPYISDEVQATKTAADRMLLLHQGGN